MIADWERATIGSVCHVVAGQSPPGTAYNEKAAGLPFYQGKKEFGAREIGPPSTWTTVTTKIAEPGDILMSVRAPVGPVNFIRERACIGRGLAAIQVSNRIDADFLFYNLWMRQSEIGGKEGAVFASINRSEIADLEIPLPPLKEQRRIVAVLDEAFAAIATATANAEKNLANARELFDRLLSDAFCSQACETQLGRMDDASLIQIIDGDRGPNYPKSSDFFRNEHCLFLSTKNVRPDGFKFDNNIFITKEKDAKLRKGKLRRHDVVMTTRGTIGNIGYYSEDVQYDHIRLNSGMLIFRPNMNRIVPSFLFELLRSPVFLDQVRSRTSGAAQPQLPIKTIKSFAFPLPVRLADQRAIVAAIDEISEHTRSLELAYLGKLNALAGLKQAVLHRAFSGELTTEMPENIAA